MRIDEDPRGFPWSSNSQPERNWNQPKAMQENREGVEVRRGPAPEAQSDRNRDDADDGGWQEQGEAQQGDPDAQLAHLGCDLLVRLVQEDEGEHDDQQNDEDGANDRVAPPPFDVSTEGDHRKDWFAFRRGARDGAASRSSTEPSRGPPT